VNHDSIDFLQTWVVVIKTTEQTEIDPGFEKVDGDLDSLIEISLEIEIMLVLRAQAV
jgi:hypothetical protein